MDDPQQKDKPLLSVDGLRAIPIFRRLSDEVLTNLAAIAREENYAPNEVLFEEGSHGDSMFLVIEGTALIQKVLSRTAGTFKDLGVAEPGEIFGEMALFDNLPRSATIRATTPLRVLRIMRDDFQAFLQSDARSATVIMAGIIGGLSGRLREAAQHTATLYETGNTIASIHNVHELSRRVMERLMLAILHVDASALGLWSPYHGDCEVIFQHGLVAGQDPVLCVSREGRLAGLLRYNRTPFVMRNLESDHPLRLPFALRDEDSLLVGPLIHRDDLLGYIILGGRLESFSSFHRILLASVCTQVSSALVNLAYASDAAARDRLETARHLHHMQHLL